MFPFLKFHSRNVTNFFFYFFSIMKAAETKGDKRYVDKGYGEVLLTFNGQVHETVAYYSYDDLSFIAEIGGYVGLFLGASMYQTADLFDTIIRNIRISRN